MRRRFIVDVGREQLEASGRVQTEAGHDRERRGVGDGGGHLEARCLP